MIGRTISHYEIIERLGGGGMGVVYKAHDTELRRLVAIKVIAPVHTASAELRDRFIQEARMASALDHPNICTVHEISQTDDGEMYLVMAYYPGTTLASRIKAGPLALAEAVGIARAMLEGLAAAHDRDIIHRDIKPANVVITESGLIKILDFGLAKLRANTDTTISTTPTQDSLTRPGSVIGTPAYMSPEQGRAEGVDQRADIWATGVVLYEMLTGRRPFRGKDPISLLLAVCGDDIEPASTRRPELGSWVDAILARALRKDPAHRFRTCRHFLAALDGQEMAESDTVAGDASSVTAPSMPAIVAPPAPQTPAPLTASGEMPVLVLPFQNMSGDPDNEFLSDGLTDELITDLSGVAALRVTSRTSAMQLKGCGKDLPTIGRELKVRYALEGSVQRAGERLRITVKLIETASDATVWAQKYSGNLEDVFDFQERISRSIVDALRLKLSPLEDQKLAEHPISDVQAYECYLRARQEIFRFTGDGLDRARGYLQQAIDIAGDNELLWSAMAYVHWQYVNAGISSDESYLDRAEEYTDKLLARTADSPHGHRLRGLVAIQRGTIQQVVRELKHALRGNRNDTDTLFWLALMYGFAGHPSAGRPLAKRLLDIDPLTPFHHMLPGLHAAMSGHFAEAHPPFRAAAQMDPGNPILRMTLGHFLALDGRREEAVAVFDTLSADMAETFFARLGQVYKSALCGDHDAVLAGLDDEITSVARSDMQYAWSVAECFSLIGEGGRALEWLRYAIERGNWNYPLFAEHDPLLAAARAEPGFTAVMAEVEQLWRGFEV